MTSIQIEIQLIAAVTAVACALPGVFLVLRRMAMMSDAISHTVLLGIVVGFFLTGNLASPILVVGAALTGVLTVSLVELLNRTRLVKEDAAIGLVFPVLFSVAVILISRYAGDVHLDTDAVLLGELAFAPFNRFTPFGYDLGPVALFLMGGILLINLAFILLFFKELKLVTFDPGLAAALGFFPGALHYALMGVVSVTVVGAFEAVGSILVVALMIAPPMAAYLLTDNLARMIAISGLIGTAGAISGYWLAHLLDASIAGSMAATLGLIFFAVLLCAPRRGLLAAALRRVHQRSEFTRTLLLIHLLNHEGLPEAEQENNLEQLHEHLRWEPELTKRVVKQSAQLGLISLSNGQLSLTERGRTCARQAIVS